MAMDEILEELGLTVLEVKIYKYLLQIGPSIAGTIARKTGIHRRNAYDALERLIKKGLVSYIKENNTKQYEANNPQVVLDQLNSRKSEWEDLMPKLHAQMEGWSDKKETTFFQGIDGLKHIFWDQLDVAEEILVHATGVDVTSIVKYFFPKYQLIRKEKKIPTRMLFDKEYKKEVAATAISKLPLSKRRFIEEYNTTNVSKYIYGDNVAIVYWADEPSAILIRGKEYAESFRKEYELLWKLGK